MLEALVMLVFVLGLIFAILVDVSTVYALIFGYIIFFGYALKKKKTTKEILHMSLIGVKSVKEILVVFILIGVVTALWRASGTISVIIYYGVGLIKPSIFVLATFLLCAFLSTLIGTSLGTCATMGVICITIARAMGINEAYVAGAVLSGVYYGDRCSPMSTSALLISEVTNTNFYDNIVLMFKTAAVPTVLTCVFYYFLGKNNGAVMDNSVVNLFNENYALNWMLLIPAIIIIIFSLLKFNMKISLGFSIATSFVLAMVFQNESIANLLRYAIFGYSNNNEVIDQMMHGGGAISMVEVGLIIAISSSYSGIFYETKILDGLKKSIEKLIENTTEFFGVFITGTLGCAIACNQSLATLLTEQICRDSVKKERLAIFMENSIIPVSALIPWNIGLKVPVDTLGVGASMAFFAAYLYILPLHSFIVSIIEKRKLREKKI